MKKLLIAFLFSVSLPLLAQKPSSYLVDNENLFSAEQCADLENILNNYQKKTSIEIAVLTTPDIGDDEISNYSVTTFKKWGLGKKGLNNGMLLVISAANRKWHCTTGYGLEELIPDATCKEIGDEILPPNFRNGDYYGGVKAFLLRVQKKIGNDGFEQMIAYKKKIEKERAEANSIAFWWTVKIGILIVFLVAMTIGIVVIIRRRKKYKEQVAEIQNLLKRVALLHSQISTKYPELKGDLPKDLQQEYDKYYIKKVTKKDFTEQTKDNLNALYDTLIEHQQFINTVEGTITKITNNIKDAQKYLDNKYEHCEKYLKDELKSFIPDVTSDVFTNHDYTQKRLQKLIGIQSIFENKFSTFLEKTAKVSSFSKDYEKMDAKIAELDKQYESYLIKKQKLSTLKVGKQTLVNLDYDKLKAKMISDMKTGFENLKNNEYDKAVTLYATYFTTIAVIVGAFAALDKVLGDYSSGESYIKQVTVTHPNTIDEKIKKIEQHLHDEGVSPSRKTQLEEIKKKIPTFQSTMLLDVIAGALLLKMIVDGLDSVYNHVQGDKQALADSIAAAIAAEAARKRREQEEEDRKRRQEEEESRRSYSNNNDSYSSPSSPSDFGGFGGGDSGGGGAGGSW